MDLEEVIAGIAGVRVTGNTRAPILAVACDSRKVTRGSLFFALPGAKADGNEFVASAIERGAIAVASPLPRIAGIASDIAWIELMPGKERQALALAAANFYRHPAEALQLVGVTGTNGKTTITFIMDSILRAAEKTTARIGTTGYQTPKGFRAATNTTPESLDLQQMFARGTRGRWNARGAGSQLARSGNGAHLGLPFCGGDFHEPDARPFEFS